MTIPAYTTPTTESEYKKAREAIMSGKLLSYVPEEGWDYRTMDEISGNSKDNEKV